MQQLQLIIGVIIITFTLISLLVFVFATLTMLQRRKKEALQQLSILAEVTAQEKDKARLTYKLHEEFGATLSVVKMGINSVETYNKQDEQQIEKSTRYLDDMIIKIRSIAADYLPYTLQKKQLVRTLEWFVDSTTESHEDMTITFRAGDDIPEISEHKTLHLYRIVQEIVHNTIKHAHATALWITLTKQENKLLLVTKDNGVGFDYSAELQKEKGVGLNNISNRVALINGTINVLSERNKGTAYMIEMPLCER